MVIGGKKIECDILLAPMAGVADTAFRILCRELGFTGLAFTEMVSVKGLCYRDAKSFELAKINGAEKPVAIQLFGSEPDAFARAAELLGENDADFIDINMGCPMPKITKNGGGAALMLEPGLAGNIVKAAAGASAKPVSVKIRKGWDGDHVNAADFAKRLEDAGASMITVHGRTRDQLYGGKADWKIIEDVKKAVGIPVTGNGDVTDGAGAVKMMRETGCDGVMIGRAARGNPWVLLGASMAAASYGLGCAAQTRDCTAQAQDRTAQAQNITAQAQDSSALARDGASRKSVMKRHLELAVLYRGERMGVLEMRKHLAWYIKGVKGASALRDAIFRLTEYDGLLAYIDKLDI